MPLNPAMQMGAHSWFSNAHNFTLSNPIMISNDVALETEWKSQYGLVNRTSLRLT